MMLKKMLFKKDALTSLAACTSGCTVGRSSTARSRLILRRALSSTPPLAVKSEAAKQQAIERLKRQEAYEREYKKSARHPLNRQEPYRPYKLSERIFVRGIPDYVQPWDAETKLHEMFSSFGEILSIDLDATARPGNYRCAYIKYRTTESAQAAVAVCEKDPVFIDKDHLLQVEPFNPTRQLKERLYFNPVQLSRDDITNILLPYASVIEKHSAFDVDGQENVIHGFIDFKTVEAAKQALEELDDRLIFGSFGAVKFHIAFSAKPSLRYEDPEPPPKPELPRGTPTAGATSMFSRASGSGRWATQEQMSPRASESTDFSRGRTSRERFAIRSSSALAERRLSPKKLYGKGWQKRERLKEEQRKESHEPAPVRRPSLTDETSRQFRRLPLTDETPLHFRRLPLADETPRQSGLSRRSSVVDAPPHISDTLSSSKPMND